MNIGLSSKEIEEIINGKFTINFFNGSIFNYNSSVNAIGHIYLNSKKQRKCKVFIKSDTLANSPFKYFKINTLPGQLVPEDECYKLEAKFYDTSWKSYSFIPNRTVSYEGIIVQNHLHYIEKVTPFTVNYEFIELYYDYQIDLPFNTISQESKKITQRFLFQNGKIKVEISQLDEHRTKVRIDYINGLDFENEIITFLEGIQILIGIKLNPIIEIKLINKILKTRVYSSKKSQPIDTIINTNIFSNIDDIFLFLNCYTNKFNRPNNLYFETWQSIVSSDNQNLKIKGLNFTTSIEKLIKKYYSSQYISSLQQVIKEEKNKQILNSLKRKFDVETLAKIQQVLLIKPNTSTILKQLPFVSPEHSSAWGKIRNSLAHGDSIESSSDQKLQLYLDRLDNCIELFYLILFDQIGYKGNFIKASLNGREVNWSNICKPKFTLICYKPNFPIVPFKYPYDHSSCNSLINLFILNQSTNLSDTNENY